MIHTTQINLKGIILGKKFQNARCYIIAFTNKWHYGQGKTVEIEKKSVAVRGLRVWKGLACEGVAGGNFFRGEWNELVSQIRDGYNESILVPKPKEFYIKNTLSQIYTHTCT